MTDLEFDALTPDNGLKVFHENRWLAHETLFQNRHPDESSDAHEALVAGIYQPGPRQLIEGFRGLGKSTYLEEAAILRAGFKEFRYMVIVGSSYGRACDRLGAIKNELVVNEDLQRVFGKLVGSIWQEGKIILANGVCIQALGRDQSMLGMKYNDTRPDAALVDDVEDPDEVRTDMDREQTWAWFIKTFLPSLAHPLGSWVRVLGTRRGSGSLPERLERDRWPTLKLPIEHQDGDGVRRATWPAKFPIEVIDRLRQTYRGDMQTFHQEYMCEPTSQADRIFTREMFKYERVERTWQAVYAMIDPARTTNRQSAATGFAVWSWLGNRLHVWASGAEMLKPDEIIELCFKINEQFSPVEIGVEEDGLNEWIKQPLRHEQLKRHQFLPIVPLRAPKSKLSFIGGLQNYFNAGEILFNEAQPDLEAQLLSFPTGKIDAPNALAYAVPLRPAAPVYEAFGPDNVVLDLDAIPGKSLYLVANATRSMVAAALAQFVDGQLMVLADWLEEGDVAEAVVHIHGEAGLAFDTSRPVEQRQSRNWADLLKLPERRLEISRLPIKWIVPPHHADRWNNVGLMQAIGRIPAVATRGSASEGGRASIVGALGRRGALQVSDRARWTLRGFSGGYTRGLQKGGGLTEEAKPGPYRLLMEGLESFAGIMAKAPTEDEDEQTGQNFATDRHGRKYLSAMPQR